MPYDFGKIIISTCEYFTSIFLRAQEKDKRRKPAPRERCAYTPEDEGVGALNLKV